ncbi:MAG: PorT family protein [Bacteroidetes bacterium]|nr:PorT family protein [Bacteroidota bacterium]MBS1973696.1 PorT family protein [Bacteroidota bacterium]
MKELFFSLFFIMAVFVASAQLSFGPKAGINISKVKLSNIDNFSASTYIRFYAGAFANYALSDRFAAQVEATYSLEGAKVKDLLSGDNENAKANFINVPILFQYISPFGVYAETGPQVSFLLAYKDEVINGETYNNTKNFHSVDFSWDFGLGYKLKQFVPGLGINARYMLGLTNLQKSEVNGGTIKGRIFSVGLFYALEHKK